MEGVHGRSSQRHAGGGRRSPQARMRTRMGSRGEDASWWRRLRKVWAGLAGEEVDEGRAW
jgi:hypothetical protein